ncbi:MAG: EpsG family protein [Cetobacterium sp.]
MWEYIVIYVYSVTAAIINILTKKKLTFFFIVSFLSLWLFTGLKYDTGWDYIGYKNFFENLSIDASIYREDGVFIKTYYEIGYKILNLIIRVLTSKFEFLNLIISFIIMLLISKNLKIYTQYPEVSFLYYFSTVYLYLQMSTLRQGLAASILFFSFKYIIEKNMLKYCFYVFVASLFHSTAGFFIIFYIILNKVSNFKLIVIIVISNFIFLFQIEWLKKTVEVLLTLSQNDILDKIYYYMNTERFGENRGIGVGYIERISMCYMLYKFEKNNTIERTQKIFIKLYYVYVVFYLLFFEVSVIFDRIKLYFQLFNSVTITYFLYYKSIEKRVLVLLIIIIYTLFSLFLIFRYEPNWNVFIPYNSIFKNENGIPTEQKGQQRIDKSINKDHNNK